MICELSSELEAYFAASPIGPLLEVGRIERDADHPLNAAMRDAFRSVSEEILETVRDDGPFRGLHGRLDPSEQDWFAREWVVVQELARRISDRRARSLLSQQERQRPEPYDQSALSDLDPCEEVLVPLSAFEILEGVLIRNGHAFTILPPTPAPNSSYWLTRTLHESQIASRVRVRLDPFLHGPADAFPRMAYRMLWYGPPLRWENVRGIQEQRFGRWFPASLSSGGQFTDFVFTPRGHEVHLTLEEVPKPGQVHPAFSRYFHVIFSRERDVVTHLDGACRIFSAEELAARSAEHVRDAGKVGSRVKVLRIDGDIEVGPVSALGGTFFVWNYDAAHFFGADVPAFLLGDAGSGPRDSLGAP